MPGRARQHLTGLGPGNARPEVLEMAQELQELIRVPTCAPFTDGAPIPLGDLAGVAIEWLLATVKAEGVPFAGSWYLNQLHAFELGANGPEIRKAFGDFADATYARLADRPPGNNRSGVPLAVLSIAFASDVGAFVVGDRVQARGGAATLLYMRREARKLYDVARPTAGDLATVEAVADFKLPDGAVAGQVIKTGGKWSHSMDWHLRPAED